MMKKNKTNLPGGPLPEILFITSYPPRECGIATYSEDLKKALDKQFSNSFTIQICALESGVERSAYNSNSKYTLNVDSPGDFASLAKRINANPQIRMVLIQHEFGFFAAKKDAFIQFMDELTKPVIIVFHTILPHPDELLRKEVQKISGLAESIIVMTQSSAQILITQYTIQQSKIVIIPHGTHLVQHLDEKALKNKYRLRGKKVLSTFGLLSQGKSIETTLNALPEVVKLNPDVIFLIIGKTHPSVLKQEGEKYRNMLEAKVIELKLEAHVHFINYFIPLADLLEYLQLTDIYLFTSKDPNQAVSGTFSYAISCGCPVISTPIPHASEVLKQDAGIIFDFGDSAQLSKAINSLLKNETLRKQIGSNGLYRMASTAWQNTTIAHAMLFEQVANGQITLRYNMLSVNLDHVKKMTTGFGMLQFSKLNNPDIDSGYTLDDNARALIAMCQHYELTGDEASLHHARTFLNFIVYCQQPGGHFLNYVDEQKQFTGQNNSANLEDSNGRAIWALGYLLSLAHLLPPDLVIKAESILKRALPTAGKIHSSRAMGFVIKGLYYYHSKQYSPEGLQLVKKLADRLVQMYRHEKTSSWPWFESYLTYANSVLPEAMLLAWLLSGDAIYKEIAKTSFDFLLSRTFTGSGIKVIPNKSWLNSKQDPSLIMTGGEQPIDVAYTILALQQFHSVFSQDDYNSKMETAFNWFLGDNHLHQIIYNPCTGGCYDGLEETCVNLNQGAESTISYLLARFAMEQAIIDNSKYNKPAGSGTRYRLATDTLQE